MIIGPGIATAKTPTWSMAVVRIPTSVSPGAYAAYTVTIKNTGKSNIAKLFLTDTRPEHPYAVSPSTGCAATGQLLCSLGALGPGKSVKRTVVYATPSTGASFNVTFEANTSGVSGSDGGTSHGDTLRKSVSTALNGSADFAGGYIIDPGSDVSTGDGGQQKTTVTPPASGIGVTITESGSGNPCSVGTPIGQLTTLNVNDGATFSDPFKVVLKIPSAGNLPDELELGAIKLCHEYDNGHALLLPKCAADAAPASGGAACFWPKFSGIVAHPDHESHGEQDADDYNWLILDIWDYQNGGIRGGF